MQTISLLLLLALSFTTAPVSAQDGTATTTLGAEAAQILADVNQARVDNGLPALALNPALTLASQAHVDDVIANGNWGHYGSDGSNVQLRTARRLWQQLGERKLGGRLDHRPGNRLVDERLDPPCQYSFRPLG